MEKKVSLKDRILKLLENQKGINVSGEEMANVFEVSRTAVWKVIKDLKEQGYKIDAARNKGYMLSKENDFLSEEKINLFLKEKGKIEKIHIFKEIDSTNNEAKKMAINGATHGTVVLAEKQTKGRGRRGNKEFYSPANSGIYMSVILRPNLSMEDITLITTATSVAICRAIENLLKLNPKIKWINDIYLNDKKVCGILTEGVTDFETGTIETVILGVGINFNTDDFPEEIKEKAGSLTNQKIPKVSRNRLIAEILKEIFKIMETIQDRKYLAEYREKSWIIGDMIEVITSEERYRAKAIDIMDDGALQIEREDGRVENLISGEISILKK
ncbi:MAG: biotin--[acetyl-CoA-carboxylase] ligase [Fusobacteriaceae bacterium]